MKEKTIDRTYLRANPNHIFVFGDNTKRVGNGGAAILRDEPNVYGFVTKILPTHAEGSYYKPGKYAAVYETEMKRLKKEIEKNPDNHYLITRLGAGLANKFHIWEKVIQPNIKKDLAGYKNVEFLWEDE